MVSRMPLLTFYHYAASLAAIADGRVPVRHERFKISSAHLADFKTFRAAVAIQFGLGNDKMAMPAPDFTARVRHHPQHLVFAGIHSKCSAS
jgi:hypothetical protein